VRPVNRSEVLRWENRLVTEVPIACTLKADEVVHRLAEWKAVFSRVIGSVDYHESGATLTLLGGSESLLTITELAEREKACCSFFFFSIELDGVETRLVIDVPTEAEPVLTELLTLLPEHLRKK
jgi:hypothetical protein